MSARALSACVAVSISCGGGSALECPGGERIEGAGIELCVYDDPMRFEECPPEVPNLVTGDDGVICVADPDRLPPDACSRIGAECGERTEWFVYLSNESGTVEIWAARVDDVTVRTRLTDFSDEPAPSSGVRGINHLRVSPDERRIAFTGLRNRAGDWHVGSSVYVIDVDGASLVNVAETAASGEVSFGCNWESDSRHLLYTVWDPCSDVVYRADVDTLEAEVLADAEDIRVDAKPNPIDREDVIMTHQSCGEGGTLYRHDLARAVDSPVPGIVGSEARHAEWMPDGDSIVFAAAERVLRHDVSTGTSITVWERERGPTLEFVVPIHEGRELLGVAIEDGIVTGVGVLRDGELTTYDLPVAAVSTVHIGRFGDIDCDGDQLANGIDPDAGC